jgi:hypothetical protein
MLQRDGMVMVEMKVLVMEMMMMISMKSSAMVMTMATISPLREGISPVDSYLPVSFSLSDVFRPAEAAVSISEPLLHLGFRGRRNTQRGDGISGPGWPHHRLAQPGVGPRPLVVSPPCCSSRLLLLASPGFWQTIIFWYFSRIFRSSEIWCLDGPFSSRILTPVANPPMIIKHVKTEETT